VSESPAQTGSYEVTCPHCKKPFQAELLEGDAARYNGFKCPHCRLFVPYERVVEQAEPRPTRAV
jgi:DNA-directed RNA polymerase subunit RPC12/RpoP